MISPSQATRDGSFDLSTPTSPPHRHCLISSLHPTSHIQLDPGDSSAIMALSVDQKRLKATKFPPEFDKKVDIKKVNIDLMKKWIAGKITTILGDEDDVVVETCYNLIEQNQFVSEASRHHRSLH